MKTSTNKYPQGYANKIAYWIEQFAEAMTNEDRAIAQSKIDYFTKRQAELDGKNQTISKDVKMRIEKRFGYVVLDFTDIQNIIK